MNDNKCHSYNIRREFLLQLEISKITVKETGKSSLLVFHAIVYAFVVAILSASDILVRDAHPILLKCHE